jgi:hypothetical protein
MIKQISLSQHIKIQLDESKVNESIVNEGLFDKMKSFWSGTASIWGNIKSAVGGESEKGGNKVLDTLKDQMKQMQAAEKDKIKKFQEAKENKLAEKIKAKYALKKQQMSLKWDKKIKEQQSIGNKYKEEANFFSKTTRIYSDSEMKAIEARLDNDFTEADPASVPTGAAKVRENMMLLLRKEDGTLRTDEELKTFVQNEGKEIWKEFNNGVEANADDIRATLESGGFQEYMAEVAADAADRAQLDNDINDADDRHKLCEGTETSLKKYKEVKDKYKEAKAAVDKFGDADEIDDSNANDLLKGAFNETDSPEDVKAKLKSMGLSDEQVDQVCAGRATASAIKGELDLSSLTSEQRSSIISSMNAAKQAAISKLDSNPNPDDPESNGYAALSEEDRNAIENARDIIKASHTDENGNVGEINWDTVDTTALEEEAKAEKETAKKKLTELQDKKADLEAAEAAKQQAAKEAHETVKQRGELKELKDTDAYKDAVKAQDPDLNAGEIKKEVNGKQVRGFEDANGKFHPIPDIGDEEGYKKYEEERMIALAAKPLKGSPVIKKQSDGTYTATYPDGTEETGLSKEDAAKKFAEAERDRKERNDIEEGKKMVAERLKKMTADEYNKLKKKADDGDESARALMKVYDKAVNDEDFFKDSSTISQKLADDAKKNIENSEIDFDYRKDGREEESNKEDDADSDEDNEDGTKKKLRDLDDTDVKDENGNPMKNPAKEYHQKTYKRGDKSFTTKSYYDKDGKNPISAKEYKERVEKFKAAYKKKNESSLSQHIANLVENKSRIKSITLSIKY